MSEKKKNYYAPMHTAEHILNRTMVNMFGCERSEHCHIERKKSKCDFRLEKEPTENEIHAVEKKVLEVINAENEVTEQFVSYEEAAEKYTLHRIKNAEDQLIRIINIGDYDDCPCIGEHVKNTGEIKNFRITTTSYTDGIFRVRFKI